MNEHPRPKKAVAVRYEAGRDRAPRVIAKGERLLAERILALAREHGVTVHEDPDLVGLLAKLDIESEIPESLYVAMAEVLAFVYRLNNRMAEARRG